MKELSFEKMEEIKGGNACYWSYAGFAMSTIGLFASPFTGPVGWGLLALGSFVASAYGAGSCWEL